MIHLKYHRIMHRQTKSSKESLSKSTTATYQHQTLSRGVVRYLTTWFLSRISMHTCRINYITWISNCLLLCIFHSLTKVWETTLFSISWWMSVESSGLRKDVLCFFVLKSTDHLKFPLKEFQRLYKWKSKLKRSRKLVQFRLYQLDKTHKRQTMQQLTEMQMIIIRITRFHLKVWVNPTPICFYRNQCRPKMQRQLKYQHLSKPNQNWKMMTISHLSKTSKTLMRL